MMSNVHGEVDEVKEERLRRRDCYRLRTASHELRNLHTAHHMAIKTHVHLIEWFLLSSGSYLYFYCKRVVACSQL